jgi:hypothetical protein
VDAPHLIACLKRETPMAREVQAYFLHAGEAFAINAVADQETCFSLCPILSGLQCV